MLCIRIILRNDLTALRLEQLSCSAEAKLVIMQLLKIKPKKKMSAGELILLNFCFQMTKLNPLIT